MSAIDVEEQKVQSMVIVEDFPPVARSLARLLSELIQPSKIEIFPDLPKALEHLNHQEVDLLFLDLNLRGHDGFDLLRECMTQSFHTIVVSANTDRAIEAFEYGVLDFVPKPVRRERLEQALARIQGASAVPPASTRYLSVRRRGEIQLIELETVNYLKAAGKYTELYMHDGQVILHDKSIERLTTILAPDFQRVHKSYVIPLARISTLETQGAGRYAAKLKTGERIPVGRTRYQKLKEQLL